MIKLFKIVSYLEGVSYILLLIAVPIKYFLNNEYWVKTLGMPHGILFLIYVFLAIFLGLKFNWKRKKLIIVLFASIIPLGTFYIDFKYFN